MDSESLGRANENGNNFCNWFREQNVMRIHFVSAFLLLLLAISCLIRSNWTNNENATLSRWSCWSHWRVTATQPISVLFALSFRFVRFTSIEMIVCACVWMPFLSNRKLISLNPFGNRSSRALQLMSVIGDRRFCYVFLNKISNYLRFISVGVLFFSLHSGIYLKTNFWWIQSPIQVVRMAGKKMWTTQ